MKRLLAVLAILLAIFLWHTEAVASCTTTTYFLPNGRVMICTTCCFGGSCTVNCI